MKKFIVKCFTTMAGLYISSLIFPSIILSSPGEIFAASVVLGLINLFIRPFLLLIALPINLVTLGLFTFVINALLLMLTAHLTSAFFIPSFWLACLAAIILYVLNALSDRIFLN